MSGYQVLHENGSTKDVLESGDYRIIVSRTGAEIVSLGRRNRGGGWAGFLYRDAETGPPASGWANHATVMGYFIHRLWNQQSVYRDATIRSGNHGFLRHFAFEAPTVTDKALVYHVPADRVPPEAYPLKVSLNLAYSISELGVRVEFYFTNEEAQKDAHVSFGLHPGFAVSSIDSCRILLPEGTYLRYGAPGNFLDGTVEEIQFAGGEMPFEKDKLYDSYLLGLARVPSRIITLEDPKLGKRLALDFSEVPFLTLWSDMNPFVCIEPCWGLPDGKPPVPFEKKLGIEVIPAGQSLRRSFSMRPAFLS